MTKHTQGPWVARFQYVAGWQAPQRKTVKVTQQREGNLIHGYTLKLECGHEKDCVPHFHYTVGEMSRCSQCGNVAASKLPEFLGWYDENGNTLQREGA